MKIGLCGLAALVLSYAPPAFAENQNAENKTANTTTESTVDFEKYKPIKKYEPRPGSCRGKYGLCPEPRPRPRPTPYPKPCCGCECPTYRGSKDNCI